MQVSFIIPLYNCLAHTRECVSTLQASLPSNLSYEVILVDDGSSDGTREWLTALTAPFRVVLNERNLGYAAANNRGAAIARGELLCLLNNDLVLLTGWLQPMLALHRRLGLRAGLVGNVQRAVSNLSIDHSGIVINHQGKPEHDRNWYPWPRRARIVPAVTGACVLVQRTLFQEKGGFDESFKNGGEDVDLCFRLFVAGHINVVSLRSTVLHHISASPGRKFHDEENSRLLTEKWRPVLVHFGLRQWTWHHLATHWSHARDPRDWPAAVMLFAYGMRLRHAPPASALAGLHTALDAEALRWAKLRPRC